jgi:hypothetical protein
MKPSPRHAIVLTVLPLMLAACATLLQPKPPAEPAPWLPTQPLPEPGEQMPLYPPN